MGNIQTGHDLPRPNYDTSTKPYEIQWNHYSRRIKNKSYGWIHWKYYDTEESAIDAIRDLRSAGSRSIFVFYRYRIIKRQLI